MAVSLFCQENVLWKRYSGFRSFSSAWARPQRLSRNRGDKRGRQHPIKDVPSRTRATGLPFRHLREYRHGSAPCLDCPTGPATGGNAFLRVRWVSPVAALAQEDLKIIDSLDGSASPRGKLAAWEENDPGACEVSRYGSRYLYRYRWPDRSRLRQYPRFPRTFGRRRLHAGLGLGPHRSDRGSVHPQKPGATGAQATGWRKGQKVPCVPSSGPAGSCEMQSLRQQLGARKSGADRTHCLTYRVAGGERTVRMGTPKKRSALRMTGILKRSPRCGARASARAGSVSVRGLGGTMEGLETDFGVGRT